MRIAISSLDLSDLRKKARELQSSSGVTYSSALTQVAVDAGYEDWRELATSWRRNRNKLSSEEQSHSFIPSYIAGDLHLPAFGIVVVCGSAGSGKSTAVFSLLKQSVSTGHTAEYIDFTHLEIDDHSREEDTLKAFQIQPNELKVTYSRDGDSTLEDALVAAYEAIRSGISVVALADVGGLTSSVGREMQLDRDKRYRLMLPMLQKLQIICEEVGATLILEVHTYSAIGRPGGKVVAHQLGPRKADFHGIDTIFYTSKVDEELGCVVAWEKRGGPDIFYEVRTSGKRTKIVFIGPLPDEAKKILVENHCRQRGGFSKAPTMQTKGGYQELGIIAPLLRKAGFRLTRLVRLHNQLS